MDFVAFVRVTLYFSSICKIDFLIDGLLSFCFKRFLVTLAFIGKLLNYKLKKLKNLTLKLLFLGQAGLCKQNYLFISTIHCYLLFLYAIKYI